MKYNKNRRFILTLYLAAASTALLTGFTSFAAESDHISLLMRKGEPVYAEWDFGEIPQEIHTEILNRTEEAAEEAQDAYLKKQEEERKAAEKQLKRRSDLPKNRRRGKPPLRRIKNCLRR